MPKDELNLWRFDGAICDHGVCIGDCDKCNRGLPFADVEDEEDVGDGTD